MLNKIKYWLAAGVLLYTQSLFAQRPEVEMADIMRSNGKIYVVVAVLAVLFVGIMIYLISIDRKLSKLEKESKEK